MADLNTGTNIILSEAETKRKDGAEHAIPGAFPSTPGTSSETTKDFIGDSQVAAAGQPVPPPQTDVGDSQPAAINIAISAQPVPPSQTEVGTGNVASSTGLQHRSPPHDENPASRFQGGPAPPADNERSPVNKKDKGSNDTVEPAELAKEVGESAATAAVAGGIAAKDAAVWTKDKAVENYPAARDTVAENATWAKDRVAENYPAVRDQAVDAASKAGNAAYTGAATAGNAAYDGAATAGNAAYSGVASAAATIASTAQAAYNATASALTTDTQTDTLPPASSVPEPVKDSFATAKKSPEAAANPVAVGDKRALESELLAIAGDKDTKTTSNNDTKTTSNNDTKTTSNRPAETSISSTHDKPSPLEGKGPSAGHMPNRTESTDFVKILGTETYKPHGSPGSTGLGAAAQETSPAHGGGPAAPHDAGRVTGGAVPKQGDMSRDEPEMSYTHDKSASRRSDMHPQGIGMGGQSSGTVSGTPRSLQGSSGGDHVAPPTGTAAQAPGHGPVEHNPPSYSQAQRQGQAPAKTTVGNNAVKEVDYNKLSSGTQSGVASTHYQSK